MPKSSSGPLQALALCLPLVLGACSSDEETTYLPCPSVVIIPEAAALTRFSEAGRDLSDIRFEAAITGAQAFCAYEGWDLDIWVDVDLDVQRGPAMAAAGSGAAPASFSYFMALASRDLQVIAREGFEFSAPLNDEIPQIQAAEQLGTRVTLARDSLGDDLVVLLGIELSREELAYNRNEL